jgi:hypothetical protein
MGHQTRKFRDTTGTHDTSTLGGIEVKTTVEITTTGRRTGQPRRIETWRYRADGRYWLTGARAVTDPEERARVFGGILPGPSWAGSLESWIEGSPWSRSS